MPQLTVQTMECLTLAIACRDMQCVLKLQGRMAGQFVPEQALAPLLCSRLDIRISLQMLLWQLCKTQPICSYFQTTQGIMFSVILTGAI